MKARGMRVLIFNQKGGVGKTTTAINLGAGLSRLDDRDVTLVDLDPQAHLTVGLGFRTAPSDWNVSSWLAGDAGEPCAVTERLFLVPGDHEPVADRKITEPWSRFHGHVIVDAPPSWGDDVATLIGGADWVLSPLEPDVLSLQGISRLLRTLDSVCIPWSRTRLLLCRFDERLVLHRQIRERLAGKFSGLLLPMVIRNSVRLTEAPGYGQTIFDYAPQSSGAQDYEALAGALLSALAVEAQTGFS